MKKSLKREKWTFSVNLNSFHKDLQIIAQRQETPIKPEHCTR